jgi:hypothetical protein
MRIGDPAVFVYNTAMMPTHHRISDINVIKRKMREKKMKGYCVRCRAQKEIKNGKAIFMKNGRAATKGVCLTCGTSMFRFGHSK